MREAINGYLDNLRTYYHDGAIVTELNIFEKYRPLIRDIEGKIDREEEMLEDEEMHTMSQP
jgi:hypothetical protein